MNSAPNHKLPEGSWTPSYELITESEVIGRRLFRKSGTTNEEASKQYKWKDFYDSRLEEDLSVDRLGTPTIDGIGCNFLTGLACEEAENRKLEFRGWAAIQNKKLKDAIIEPRPIPEINPFHGEILRDAVRDKMLSYYFACALRMNFQDHGFYHSGGQRH